MQGDAPAVRVAQALAHAVTLADVEGVKEASDALAAAETLPLAPREEENDSAPERVFATVTHGDGEPDAGTEGSGNREPDDSSECVSETSVGEARAEKEAPETDALTTADAGGDAVLARDSVGTPDTSGECEALGRTDGVMAAEGDAANEYDAHADAVGGCDPERNAEGDSVRTELALNTGADDMDGMRVADAVGAPMTDTDTDGLPLTRDVTLASREALGLRVADGDALEDGVTVLLEDASEDAFGLRDADTLPLLTREALGHAVAVAASCEALKMAVGVTLAEPLVLGDDVELGCVEGVMLIDVDTCKLPEGTRGEPLVQRDTVRALLSEGEGEELAVA